MEFKILGPVAMSRSGVEVRIPGRRQRSLLAMLLIESGHVVPVERLQEQLWGDEPPTTARMQVQIGVSTLRKVLGAGAIQTRPPGYAIRVTPGDELDSVEFERLLGQASALSAAGDPEGAVARLDAALALWRGPALGDVPGRLTSAAAAALEDRRLHAMEQRIECGLAVGACGELISELLRLVAAYPTWERFRAQLMLALYRAGRQAEALAVYRRGRRMMIDELGMEPGVELRRLEAAILSADPSILLRLPAARSPGDVRSRLGPT